MRPLGVTEILDGAISIIRFNPRATLGPSLILTLGVQLLLTLGTYAVIGDTFFGELTASFVFRLLGILALVCAASLALTAFVVLWLAGMCGPVAARMFRGRPAQPGQAWRDIRPVTPRLTGGAALVLTGTLLALALPFAPMILFALADAAIPAVLAGILGGLAAVPLMIWFYLTFVLATPAIALERRSISSALGRSRMLLRRRWWRTFGILLLALMITAFVAFVVLPVPFIVAAVLVIAFNSDPAGWAIVAVIALLFAGLTVGGTLTAPFGAAVITLVYGDARMRQEGLDLELAIRPDTANVEPPDLWLPGPLTGART